MSLFWDFNDSYQLMNLFPSSPNCGGLTFLSLICNTIGVSLNPSLLLLMLLLSLFTWNCGIPLEYHATQYRTDGLCGFCKIPFIHTMVKCRGVIRNLNAEQHELSKSVEVQSSQGWVVHCPGFQSSRTYMIRMCCR